MALVNNANERDLGGKIAIITGGNGGIGLGIASGLVGEGATVVIAGRDKEKNANALASLRKTTADSDCFCLDINDKKSLRDLVDFVVERFGQIDILVNNAGINKRSAEPHLLSSDDWDSVINTNLRSVHNLTSLVFPHMKSNLSGKIINIGSMMSIFGTGYAAAYAASKGGIVQYTKSCAIAWAKYNVQVNAILPGWIITDLTDELKKDAPERYAEIVKRTPAQRWGSPTDVSGTAIFLSSSLSDFVTGASIPVDGGYSVF